MNIQAEELNEEILKVNPVVMEMLSSKGREIFFPKKGILSQAGEAKGKEINATIGIALEEDGSPMRLNSVHSRINIEPENVFPYASSFGKKELRDKWKEMIFSKNPLLKNEISLPVVTNALTHGLSIAGYLFINPGDKIIVPDLYWGNYDLVFKNAYGAEFETYSFFSNFKFNIEGFKEVIFKESGKKIVLLNFPNNPTGYTPSEEEIKKIIEVIRESADKGDKIIVLVDDAYFGLVYEENIFKESIFGYLADLHENILAVKIDGATKEDYAWGFRVGFLTYGIKDGEKLYSALESKTAGAIRGNISNAPHISQSIVLKSFNSDNYFSEKREKFEILKKRYDEVKRILRNEEYKKHFEVLPFNSGYFMCVRVKDAENIRKELLEKYSTGVIATGDLLRIAFSSTPTDKLEKLFENIYNCCDSKV